MKRLFPHVVALFALVAVPSSSWAQAFAQPALLNVNSLGPGTSAAYVAGQSNRIGTAALGSFIGAGRANTVNNSVQRAFIGAGDGNVAANNSVVIGGGEFNRADGLYGFVGGGNANSAGTEGATIGGGAGNRVSIGGYGTVAGGFGNAAHGLAFVGGGNLNNAIGGFSVTCGGFQNTNNAVSAFIGGGSNNLVSTAATNGTLGGGQNNRVGGMQGFLGGGAYNTANGWGSAVAGGFDNQATREYATVPGGVKARALHVGAFVWSGVDAVTTESTNARSFTVRSPGGARFISAVNNSLAGAILLPNATQWTALSSRESKTDFRPIKPREVLSKLAAMPVTSWQYKHDPSRRYIGPTSQDFMEAFHLGDYDKGINALDADGVTFAAIQGLVEELKERDKVIEELEARSREQALQIRELTLRPGSLTCWKRGRREARSQNEIDELKAEMRALREEVRANLPPSGP